MLEIDQKDLAEHIDPLLDLYGPYPYRGIYPRKVEETLKPLVQIYRDDNSGISAKKAVKKAAIEYLTQVKGWELVHSRWKGEQMWLPKERPGTK